jgi:hypothetical protein
MKEPQSDPIWATRVAVLAPLIVGHMIKPEPPHSLCRLVPTLPQEPV